MMARLPKRTAAPMKTAAPRRTVRIVCISDTHELHRELSVPDGDLLIHSGDFTFFNQHLKDSRL